MPVRIYDIARKLGLQNKDVLNKAKILGIAGAKVASSSLDKITAEFLETELANSLPKPPPAPPVPAPAPIVIIAPPDVVEEESVESAAADANGMVATGSTSVADVTNLTGVSDPAAAGSPGGALSPSDIDLKAETGESIGAPGDRAETTLDIPAIPKAPGLGEKIGFIVLPPRPGPKPGDKAAPARPQARTPGRQEAPRGRNDGGPQQRPAAAPASGVKSGAPAAPAAKAEPKFIAPTTGEVITMKPPIAIRDLAERLKRKPFQLIADLMELNVFANVNQSIEEPVAQRLCAKYGFRFELEKRDKAKAIVHGPAKPAERDPDDKPEDLKPRPPVVTIMGHVDHGKTTLLDVIRKANVASGEAGGITQHIGAYTIAIPHPYPDRRHELQQITFLDTPGHAAFSAMRARGANVTDIVVLVVAANDGVMPQTLEALNHAVAAKVQVIVAVNKVDHPNATPMKVRQQLQEKGLVCEEWGGNTIFVDVSAITKQGVDKLLEMIVLQAEVMELRANPGRKAQGNVIESGLEPGGPTATVLVRKGTLRVGEVVVCGSHYGRVRALINEEGKRLKEATPSVAVRVLGLDGVPEAGIEFAVVDNERAAREITEQRILAERAVADTVGGRQRLTMEAFLTTMDASAFKVLKLVVKADTQGSEEAIVEALKKIESDKVTLEIVHSAVGTITESDALLASASKAVILGFHTRIDNGVSEIAKREGVQIKLYTIIYELIDEVKLAMAGLLDPLIKEVVVGSAEVKKLFPLSKGGTVAGCVIASGRIVKGKVRVMRRKGLIYEGITLSLRRFQDEVTEVRAGMECGIRIDGFNDFAIGDNIECCITEKVAQKL
jgi:translation initiation factor IF-2